MGIDSPAIRASPTPTAPPQRLTCIRDCLNRRLHKRGLRVAGPAVECRIRVNRPGFAAQRCIRRPDLNLCPLPPRGRTDLRAATHRENYLWISGRTHVIPTLLQEMPATREASWIRRDPRNEASGPGVACEPPTSRNQEVPRGWRTRPTVGAAIQNHAGVGACVADQASGIVEEVRLAGRAVHGEADWVGVVPILSQSFPRHN